MLAILAPGQGAQSPGFLTSWLAHEGTSDLLKEWSKQIDLDLIRLGSTADDLEIRETSNAQPLLVAAGLISYIQLVGNQDFSSNSVNFFAGHSVGEITAATLSGIIDPKTAMSLVSARGRAMSTAAIGSETGMSAVLGGDRESVLSILESLHLVPANENGAGQIVAAGKLSDLKLLADNPPSGARIRSLAVSGAFHTEVMKPAVSALADAAFSAITRDPLAPVLSNLDGEPISNGDEFLARIVGQVAGPVRWDLCMKTLADNGVTGVIEVAPGGTLTGLFKRSFPDIELCSLKTPQDLSSAREFAQKHFTALTNGERQHTEKTSTHDDN
jgi:[acyl-carrier-protein] S-malonyltransferase